MSGNETRTCTCKVGRQIEAYDLDGVDATLVQRREKADESLRALATFLNVRILEAALERHDVPTTGDTEAFYRALTGEATPERRADVRDHLEFAGVDVNSLLADFVSHQTIRAHLQDCHGKDTSRQGVRSIAEGREIIEWARNRDQHIIDHTIAQLQRANELAGEDIDVTHSISVTCLDCNSTYRVGEFLTQNGCACGEPDADS